MRSFLYTIYFPLQKFIAHCHLEDDIVKFQRLANDPEIMTILKAIARFIEDRRGSKVGSNARDEEYLETLSQRASKFFELQGKIKGEIESAKLLWKAHFNLLSDIDELNQCKAAMRLRRENEDISQRMEGRQIQ